MSDEHVRLFVALELPESVRRTLTGWGATVLDGRAGLRAVVQDSLHVTLCFLGRRAVNEIGEIAAACEVVATMPVLQLTLGDGLWLPARRPRVLAVALGDHDHALAAVQSKLSDVLRRGGWYVPEPRPFLAHVTLARVAKGVQAPRGDLPALSPGVARGSTVTLYRSRLGRGGAQYQPLASVALGSGPSSPVS
jgi:RNA 2',3'-cyclic 3'-phosphodiesterase